jgi:acyl carrier protein
MSLHAQVIEVIAETLDIDAADIKADASLYSGVGIDSTEMVEVAVALGKKLGLSIKSGEINNKQSVNEIVAVIEKKKQ